MIPLAQLPTTHGCYVLHFSEPLAHACGYAGWAADIARRVAEHLDTEACARAGLHIARHRGSPLVCAAVRAGRTVLVAQVYPGGDRGLERRLHNRHHPRTCPLCRSQRPPRPRQLCLPVRQPAPARGRRSCPGGPSDGRPRLLGAVHQQRRSGRARAGAGGHRRLAPAARLVTPLEARP